MKLATFKTNGFYICQFYAKCSTLPALSWALAVTWPWSMAWRTTSTSPCWMAEITSKTLSESFIIPFLSISILMPLFGLPWPRYPEENLLILTQTQDATLIKPFASPSISNYIWSPACCVCCTESFKAVLNFILVWKCSKKLKICHQKCSCSFFFFHFWDNYWIVFIQNITHWLTSQRM